MQGWALRGAPMGIALNKTFVANVQALAPNPSDNVRTHNCPMLRPQCSSEQRCRCLNRDTGSSHLYPASFMHAATMAKGAFLSLPWAVQGKLYTLISTFGTHYVNKVGAPAGRHPFCVAALDQAPSGRHQPPPSLPRCPASGW